MKKLAILLSAILVLTLAGCGDNDSESESSKSSRSKSKSTTKMTDTGIPSGSQFDPANPNAKEHVDYAIEAGKEIGARLNEEIKKNEAEQEKRKQNFMKNQIEVSDAELTLEENGKLKIKSYGIEYSDFYDSDVITVTADFTNLGESNHSFLSFRNYITAYQDGIVLSYIFGEYDKETGTAVKQGKTIEVSFSYLLRNTQSDFELEGKDYSHTLRSEIFDSCAVELK